MDIPNITAAERKFVASLSGARERREAAIFVAEGERCIGELLPRFHCKRLIVTYAWLQARSDVERARLNRGCDAIVQAKPDEIRRMSSLKSSQGVMALFEIPQTEPVAPVAGELYLALDRIQDPGNLGTIIRLSDWFGIRHIFASPDTADLWNPKVVQATMGALARVSLHYCDLTKLLRHAGSDRIPVYGTFLDGDDIYRADLTPGGILVMGNEGRGVSAEVAALCPRHLKIPPYPTQAATVESLNVSVATAVTVAEFRRRLHL